MKNKKNRAISPEFIFSSGPLIPVLVIDNADDAIPIAESLIKAGISIIEVTLRTSAALNAISKISQQLPEITVGSGTVLNHQDLIRSQDAGAQFAISPGSTPELLKAGSKENIVFIPGVSSTSEIMQGINYGYTHFKFFPAEASGGVKALKSINGPFPNIRFCPTGGISTKNILEYLSLPNVSCCGGSWLITEDIIRGKNWPEITRLATHTLNKTQQTYK